MKKRFIQLNFLLILFISIAGVVNAQPPAKIEHYSTEDGLSHDIITCMFKDSQGYMWFGTWNGINRFDGHNFTSFTSIPGDSSQIKNDRIEQIFEDNANHLWVKSYDGQVYRFDKGAENFMPLSSILSLKKKIAIDRILLVENGKLWISTVNDGVMVVRDLHYDKSSYQLFANQKTKSSFAPDKFNFIFRQDHATYWIGTSNGLLQVTEKNNGKFSAQLIEFDGKKNEEFSAGAINQVELFFGTAGGDLIILDKKTNSHKRISISKSRLNGMLVAKKTGDIHITSSIGELISYDPAHSVLSTAKYNDNISLFSIFEDKFGNLWIEPKKIGIIRFDTKIKKFYTFLQRNDTNNNIPSNHYKVFEDKNGTIWSILRDGGFGYYDERNGKFNYFYNEPGSSQRRFSNLTLVTFYDPSGVMWLHTDERGLEKIIFHPNDFKQRLVVNPSLFKSQNEIRGILSDQKNRIWAGAKSGQLYIYENGLRIAINFENMPSQGIGMVYTILQAKNGVIWLGTKENGLFKADPLNAAQTSYRLTQFIHDSKKPTSISSNQIYSITEDSGGKIWIGTFDRGPNMLDPSANNQIFKHFYDKTNGYPNQFHKIRYLTFDGKNRLWIGSTDGLVIGTPTTKDAMKFQTYSKQPGDFHSLGNNDIQYILKDHLNRMWLATSGGGLNLAVENVKNQRFTFNIYSTKNGLGNNYILSCIEDKQNQIWIATKSTLTRFDPIKGKFDNFNSYDGVPKDGFSEASCQITKDGKLVFGTIKGLLTFDPRQIKYHPIKANITFTGLQINNEDVVVGENAFLEKNINNTKAIKLKYNQNTISVDYTVLDYRSVDRQRYFYRLKGFDTTWHDNKNQRRATYTNLPPGEYVLEVKSPDLDNYNSIPSKELKITISPPPWKTWWAYLIYLLFLCIAIEITRRIVLTLLRLRQSIAVEQKMTALKMAFFTNVSHELRTPLTLIVNPIEELLQQEKLSQQGREYASIVSRNASRMVRFVNQLLDLRKSQSGQSKVNPSKIILADFVREVAEHFQEAARANHIALSVNSDEPVEIWLDADKMETVIYNLLSNSFKFSPLGKQITINIFKKTDVVEIVVNDEGCGVNEDDLENIFLLYHESEHPNTQHIKGSGIGLALAKELIELHHGTIKAANRDEQGLSVTIILPLKEVNVLPVYQNVNTVEELKPISESSINEITENAYEPKENERQLILLVEDNEDMRSFLAVNLGTIYRIKTAADGLQGLVLAKKLQPDLILSDIMMPKMDGIEMLDKLKQDQETSHIPVILLSAKSALESQITGLKYGADYYISKPFDNELLFAALSNILEQRKKIIENLVSKQKILELGPSQIVVTSKDELFLQKVIAIVEEHMTDPKFNIDAVAETVHMARATFFKKFKSLTQQAPVEFIRDMRLKRAKQFLDAGMGNITEIAYTVGFSSAKYFSTCFRTLYGISPSDYLKSIDSKEEKI